MVVEEYKNDIRIEFSKVPPGAIPDGVAMAPVYLCLSAIDIPESWIPEVLCVEKHVRMWMPEDPPAVTDDALWEYVIHMDKKYDEYVRLIFRHLNVAISTMKHLKNNTQIDYKKEFPELFL